MQRHTFSLRLPQRGGCPEAASHDRGDPWSSLATGNTAGREAVMGLCLFPPRLLPSPLTAMTQPCREVDFCPHPIAGQRDGGVKQSEWLQNPQHAPLHYPGASREMHGGCGQSLVFSRTRAHIMEAVQLLLG